MSRLHRGSNSSGGTAVDRVQLQPTLADASVVERVLPGESGIAGGPHPMIFLRAQEQLSTAGSWAGLPRHPHALASVRGLVRWCLDTAINYRPPPREEPVVNTVYGIGSDGARLSGFTLVTLELIKRQCPSEVVDLRPSDFDVGTGVKDYHIEPGSSLQLLAIDSEHNRLWVRYNSRDGYWDERFAPPGIIANISFSRFDRLVEAGRGDRRRDQVLNGLMSEDGAGPERIQIRGEVFGVGDQVEMPFIIGESYKMRVLNPPDNPAISLRPTDRNRDANTQDDSSRHSELNRGEVSRDEYFWSGRGTPPQVDFDPAMNRATIVRFSRDGMIAMLRLDQPEGLRSPCWALQAGALFILATHTRAFYGSARDCYGLLQDQYLKPWYIRYPLASTILPALDSCRVTQSADFFDFGPAGE